MYLKLKGFPYIGLPTTNNITWYEDTTISGSLEAQKLILNKPSNDSETPLKIAKSSQNCEVIALESTIAGDGCFSKFKTAQPPTVWNTGIWNQSEYGIRHGVNGIWITIMGTHQ